MLSKLSVNFSCFQSLVELRRTYGNFRHDLIDIIVLAMCATVCYCETWEDIEDFGNERKEWLSQYLTLEQGIPGHDTIARVISRLDTVAFFGCLQQWIDGMKLDLQGKGIHIDGKTSRHSFDSASNLKALHLVSAWVDEASLCLGQVATEEKSNEITAIPFLLELIEIKGAVVTLDAMCCQQEIVEKIVEKQADYVITVKGNQPKLHQAIAEEFEKYFEDDRQDRNFRSHQKQAKSRSRLTHQEVIVAPVPAEIKDTEKWQGIQTIGMIYRHREPVNPDNPRAIKATDHVTYFISSLQPNASLIQKYVSQHWTVENSLHWTLDVTFTEDKSRIRKGNSPAIMGSLRRFIISLLKRDTSMPKTSLKRKRLRAALNTDKLAAVLFG